MLHNKSTAAETIRNGWANPGRWVTACLTTLFLFSGIAMLFPGTAGSGETGQQIAALGPAELTATDVQAMARRS